MNSQVGLHLTERLHLSAGDRTWQCSPYGENAGLAACRQPGMIAVEDGFKMNGHRWRPRTGILLRAQTADELSLAAELAVGDEGAR